MAGRIRAEDIEAVRQRTDLVQVVSGYLQLKKAGRDSLVGLCPFHPEKTPSLSVSPAKQVYFCHGCGEGGDVFRFVRRIENLEFAEAVERLARPAGVTLRYEGDSAASRRAMGRRQAIHRALEEAGALYHRMLLTGREAAEARAYLDGRSIGPDSIERFGIGYAPGYPDFLLKRLTKSYSPDLLEEAGLVAKDPGGTIRDRFRGRVVFPIQDLSGSAVGFGGRLLAGPHAPANAPKYLNSPETSVYRKGLLLYNLNRAKAEITTSGRAFLVEGYTDVVALDQAGVRTAVATCGTALGEEHIRLLSRFAERAVLAFDSDDAGARAAERAFAFHQRYLVDLSVLVLPKGQDPADFAQANGGGEEAGEAFEELAARAVPLVEFMLDRMLVGRSLSTVEERARAARVGLDIVLALTDEVRRHEYARVLAGKLGEPEMSVLLQLERAAAGGSATPAGTADRARRARVAPDEEVEWEALKLLVQAPELVRHQLSAANLSWFAKPSNRKAFELILEAGTAANGGAGNGSLVSVAQAKGEALGKMLAALSIEPLRAEGPVSREYAERIFLRLEEFAVKRDADAVRKELERVNPLTASDAHQYLFQRYVALERRRRELRAEAEGMGAEISLRPS
jgi:DNA primase